MSRIGSREINFNKIISCSFSSADNIVEIKTSNKDFKYVLPKELSCQIKDSSLLLKSANLDSSNSRDERRLLGLHRSLLNNLVSGLQQKFKKSLILNGVGYKAEVKGRFLIIFLGYTHNIKYQVPDDISFTCTKATEIALESYDKQLLGMVVMELCKLRKYDPYKGKGLMVANKQMLRKEANKK